MTPEVAANLVKYTYMLLNKLRSSYDKDAAIEIIDSMYRLIIKANGRPDPNVMGIRRVMFLNYAASTLLDRLETMAKRQFAGQHDRLDAMIVLEMWKSRLS